MHYEEAERAKTVLDEAMEELAQDLHGVWLKPCPVKDKEAILHRATTEFGGDIRR